MGRHAWCGACFFLIRCLDECVKYIAANCVNGIYGSNHRIFDCGKICVVLSKTGVDDITGGKNKREFERIARILLQGSGEFALVYANIDRFKLVNELYGDEEGDRVLRQVHKVIDNELLSWDEASGRIMADNFGMLLRFHSMKNWNTD